MGGRVSPVAARGAVSSFDVNCTQGEPNAYERRTGRDARHLKWHSMHRISNVSHPRPRIRQIYLLHDYKTPCEETMHGPVNPRGRVWCCDVLHNKRPEAPREARPTLATRATTRMVARPSRAMCDDTATPHARLHATACVQSDTTKRPSACTCITYGVHDHLHCSSRWQVFMWYSCVTYQAATSQTREKRACPSLPTQLFLIATLALAPCFPIMIVPAQTPAIAAVSAAPDAAA